MYSTSNYDSNLSTQISNKLFQQLIRISQSKFKLYLIAIKIRNSKIFIEYEILFDLQDEGKSTYQLSTSYPSTINMIIYLSNQVIKKITDYGFNTYNFYQFDQMGKLGFGIKYKKESNLNCNIAEGSQFVNNGLLLKVVQLQQELEQLQNLKKEKII